MSAPDVIEVRFSEEMAQYADLRPVRRQPMTFTELVGLLLTTTGKDRDRLRELLRRGTCSYNVYQYWWEPVEPEYTQLEVALDAFPDPEPSRSFDPAVCRWVRFSDDARPQPRQVTVERPEAERRRWLARQTFWNFLMRFASSRSPRYLDYSYYDQADLYGVDLSEAHRVALCEGIAGFAARPLRQRLARASEFIRLEAACVREPESLPPQA